jgi:hypothetical protein
MFPKNSFVEGLVFSAAVPLGGDWILRALSSWVESIWIHNKIDKCEELQILGGALLKEVYY